MDKLFTYLDSIYRLSTDLKMELTSKLKFRSFERKEFLLQAGQTSQNIFFIEEGLVRCYYTLKDKDISSWFMKEGDVVISVNSFFGQVPSVESIQALEKTQAQYITYNELEKIYLDFPTFNIHGRKVLTYYYRLSEQRAISMRSLKARDRYDFLLKNHPDLLQRVPRKYLASYIGMTPSSISHIHLKKPSKQLI